MRVRSPLLTQSMFLSSPPGNEMFQFPGFAPLQLEEAPESLPAGSPIRKSAPERVFAPQRGLSQLVTSFVASKSLGILHVPFSAFSFLFCRHGSSGFPRHSMQSAHESTRTTDRETDATADDARFCDLVLYFITF